MKPFRKSNLFTTFLLMLFSFSIIGFWGCEKESLFENYYSEYLELDSYEFSNMSEKDMNTIGLALQRLDIDKNTGMYNIKQTSGAQVNISEELFDYIKRGFAHTNKIFKSNSLNSSIPRLKSGDTEGDNTQPSDSTYCVAHALAGMGGVSFDDAKAYIDSIYGSGGIPSNVIDSVVYHFYPNATDSLYGGNMNNAFIYFSTSDSTGHAVNGMFYDSESGVIMYHDYQNQNNGSPNVGYIMVDSLINVYYP
ncbi:MAG: hypothetical protein AB2L24_01025 [Mangrovibacterium sp.]